MFGFPLASSILQLSSYSYSGIPFMYLSYLLFSFNHFPPLSSFTFLPLHVPYICPLAPRHGFLSEVSLGTRRPHHLFWETLLSELYFLLYPELCSLWSVALGSLFSRYFKEVVLVSISIFMVLNSSLGRKMQ